MHIDKFIQSWNCNNHWDSNKTERVMKRYHLIIADDHKMFLDGLLSILAAKTEYEIIPYRQ